MQPMTLDDLVQLLRESAGESDGLDRGEALLDTSFEDLGYDSLALMETAARIEQDYGLTIPDEEIADLETPRALLSLVNGNLAGSA